jgi:hypothetical protein
MRGAIQKEALSCQQLKANGLGVLHFTGSDPGSCDGPDVSHWPRIKQTQPSDVYPMSLT